MFFFNRNPMFRVIQDYSGKFSIQAYYGFILGWRSMVDGLHFETKEEAVSTVFSIREKMNYKPKVVFISA